MKRFVLIVDDDPDLQRAMAAELQRMDFEAAGALHYDDALDRLAERSPHFICVNLELPTRSGYELCEHLRAALALTHLPILATSNSGFPSDLANAETAGANAFLKKPFSMAEFRSCVEGLLGRMVRRDEPGMASLEL